MADHFDVYNYTFTTPYGSFTTQTISMEKATRDLLKALGAAEYTSVAVSISHKAPLTLAHLYE